MKKTLLSLAFMAGVSVFANAGNINEGVHASEVVTVTSDEDDGFVEVKLESLNENVKKAINAYSKTDTVKTIAYNAEKKLAKVTFISKSDASSKIVTFDDEGKEVK